MKIEILSITPNAEKLIEEAGRTAYQSFDKITDDSASKFIRRLIKMGHESVLEHAIASFHISNVSRTFSHQLVRHRLASFTQKSQRYYRESEFKYVEPESIKNNESAHAIFKSIMEYCNVGYNSLKDLGLKNEDCRFCLPEATQTELVITTNFREWRHIIKLRTDKAAQWEIRNVCTEILKILKEKAPSCFEDL